MSPETIALTTIGWTTSQAPSTQHRRHEGQHGDVGAVVVRPGMQRALVVDAGDGPDAPDDEAGDGEHENEGQEPEGDIGEHLSPES